MRPAADVELPGNSENKFSLRCKCKLIGVNDGRSRYGLTSAWKRISTISLPDQWMISTNKSRYGAMAVKLNQTAFDYGKLLIGEGHFVFDQRDAWSEHRPSAQQENDYIDQYGFEEYAKWYLGINDEAAKHTKARYEFPYGDYNDVHRCGVLSAESRAGQYKHFDIEIAAAHLHGMIDALKGAPHPGRSRTAHRAGATGNSRR
jgi:hypothetical protein